MTERIGDRRRFEHLPGGGYAYHCIDEPLTIEVRYLRREYSQLHAEVDVRCEWPGVVHHRGSISCADLNLSSQTARKSLAKHCTERARTKADEFDWIAAIDAACLEVIQAERKGEDVIILDDAPTITDRDFALYGLQVPADASSMLIAHGDSMKSMILLLLLGAMAQQGRRVLLVDWEWTAARHLARKRRLFGNERLDSLRYLKCRAPLTIERDRIRRYCDTEQIEFVGIDSVGLACDGKLVDDDVAIRFHRALASLPPSMCAAHVPKSSIGPDAKGEPTAFGSVYFTNLCRMSWIVRKQPGATEDVVTVGLYRQKQNDGERCRPVGLEFTFTPEQIGVRPVDLATVEGLADRLPLWQRMEHLLKTGPMTIAQMAEELDAKVDSVNKAANRRKTFTRIPGSDGIYRIALVARQVA
jgi:hypothetical protein